MNRLDMARPGLRQARRALRQALLARRRLAVAALAAAAVAAGLRVLAPEPPPTERVLVAAADLPAGRALAPEDVRPVAWPRDLVPDQVASSAVAVTGQVLAGPLRAGEPVTDARLRGSGLLAGQPPGIGAVVVRLGEPVAGLVRPGERVDLVAGPVSADSPGSAMNGADAIVVARDVLVLAAPGSDADAAGEGLLGGPDPTGQTAEGSVLVLAVTTATALRIRAAGADRALSVIGRG